MNRAILAALLFSATVHAAGPIPNAPFRQDTSDARYANDLDGADRGDQLYAARVLLRRVRESVRVGAGLDVDIGVMEARQRLDDFDKTVAPKCIRLLEGSAIRRQCARILGFLETASARGPLEVMATQSDRHCDRRAATWALRRIQDTQ